MNFTYANYILMKMSQNMCILKAYQDIKDFSWFSEVLGKLKYISRLGHIKLMQVHILWKHNQCKLITTIQWSMNLSLYNFQMLIMFLEKSKGRKSNTNSTIYPQTKRKNTRHPPPPHTLKKKHQKTPKT